MGNHNKELVMNELEKKAVDIKIITTKCCLSILPNQRETPICLQSRKYVIVQILLE